MSAKSLEGENVVPLIKVSIRKQLERALKKKTVGSKLKMNGDQRGVTVQKAQLERN